MNILKKATSAIGLNSLDFHPFDPIEKVIAVLGGQFTGMLDKVFAERLENTENSNLGRDDVQRVIEKYSKSNSGLAAAVPGPLGILSSAGELVAMTANQMRMVYDLGCCFDKEKWINKDLLLDLPLQAMGGHTGLDKIQDQSGQWRESAVEVLQKKAGAFARVIALKTLKKSLVKCVPVAGSLMMAVWAKKSTGKIANTAICFFDDDDRLVAVPPEKTFEKEHPREVIVEMIKVLATLMEQNGSIKEAGLAFLLPVIQNAPVGAQEKKRLLAEAQKMCSRFDIDYSIITACTDAPEDLLTDMVVLAKRDGTVGPNERAYLLQTNRLPGESETELLSLLAA